MSNMRPLTKSESKIFLYFLKGYFAGLKYVPTNWVRKYNKQVDFDEIIPLSYKEEISLIHRSKKRYDEFRRGFCDGYFASISSEKPLEMMDPFRCDDIYEYLKSIWLYERTYGRSTENG